MVLDSSWCFILLVATFGVCYNPAILETGHSNAVRGCHIYIYFVFLDSVYI